MQRQCRRELLLLQAMMTPSFSYSEDGAWSILRVHGELDIATAPLLRQRVVAIVSSGVQRLVLDLLDVDFIDSTGLGVLIGALKRFRTIDGELRLVMDKESGRWRLFETTGLDTIFDVYDTAEDAVLGKGNDE